MRYEGMKNDIAKSIIINKNSNSELDIENDNTSRWSVCIGISLNPFKIKNKDKEDITEKIKMLYFCKSSIENLVHL